MELHYDIDCLTLCGAWGLEGLPDFMCPPFPPEYNVGLRGRRTRPWTLGAIKSERFFRKTESMFLSPNVGARRPLLCMQICNSTLEAGGAGGFPSCIENNMLAILPLCRAAGGRRLLPAPQSALNNK